MSIIGEVGSPSQDIIYVNFNQTSTALSAGTTTGYKLYKIEEAGKFHLDYECTVNEEVHLVERHYLSSLVAYVKTSCPRNLIFYNFNNKAEIGVKHFANTIHSVKLNRKIFVVCLEDSLHIFDMMLMYLSHVITNMPLNPNGICALTSHNGDSLLAYPGSSTVGHIQIFDAAKLLAKCTISAHNNPIACLSFNDDGTKIASASVRGTIIRVFSVTDGSTLFEFRRGRRDVTVCSLSFSSGSEFLCASSNTETVHVFKLSKDEDNKNGDELEDDSWLAAFGKAMTYSARYLPSQVSDVFLQQRAFATIHLPFSGLKNIACISRCKKMFYVYVMSSDGIAYTYHLNVDDGSCTLIRQHRLDKDGDTAKVHKPMVSPSHSSLEQGDNSPKKVTTEKGSGDSDGEASDSGAPLSFKVT